MLVILPGWMHDAAQWKMVSTLLNNMKVEHVVLDFPGFGTTTKDDAITDFDHLVTWCRSEIKQLVGTIDDTSVTLLGHSSGGRIALALAAENRNYRQLILVGSPNLYRPSFTIQVTKVLSRLAAPFKSLLPNKFISIFRSDDYSQATQTGMQELYQSVVTNDQTAIASGVKTATHLLWGEHDTAAPLRIAYELDELLSNSTLTILPNLGHNLHHENPRLLAGKIKLFLDHD